MESVINTKIFQLLFEWDKITMQMELLAMFVHKK